MARKPLVNSYELENRDQQISEEDLVRAVTDFSFLCENYMQIVDKQRRTMPFKLNRAQKYIFETLWPMLSPDTRLERHRQVIIVKGRQIGATVSVVSFVNFICSFAQGIRNMTILHSLPVTDTISKLAKRKVEPIVTGIHPILQPEIFKDTLGSSITYSYDNILNIKRRNVYELVSANSNSIRSDTVSVWLADECAWYRHPEELEDVIGGAMPDQGFSLSVFFSTYGEKYNDFFLKKIQMAIDNPEEADLIFVPWFLTYPERSFEEKIDFDSLSDYERNTIVPALDKYKIPREEWDDKILWYRRKSLTVPHIKQEFPTVIEEVLNYSESKKMFSDEVIQYQRENQMVGKTYSLVTDTITKEVKAVFDDSGQFSIIKTPVYGRKYILIVDPIAAQNEDTDYCAMTMWDIEAREVVALFRGKSLPTEDYADIAVAAAKLYNRAQICPETNLCEAFMICVRAQGYFNIYYSDKANKSKRIAGIRTTATSKPAMLNKLLLLAQQHKILLRHPDIINEMEWLEKKTRMRSDGTPITTASAKKGKHDDLIMTAMIFAGTVDLQRLSSASDDLVFLW